jgi:hypothetical protein
MSLSIYEQNITRAAADNILTRAEMKFDPPTPKTRRPESAAAEDEAFLTSRGWQKTAVEIRLVRSKGTKSGYKYRVTYWEKNGKEYPQHFALWIEKIQPKCIVGEKSKGVGA